MKIKPVCVMIRLGHIKALSGRGKSRRNKKWDIEEDIDSNDRLQFDNRPYDHIKKEDEL